MPASHYEFVGITCEITGDDVTVGSPTPDFMAGGCIEAAGAVRAAGNVLTGIDITGFTVASNVATVTVAAHGFLTGDVIGVTQAGDTDLDGLHTITYVSSSQFTFPTTDVPDGDYLTDRIHYQSPPSEDYIPDDIVIDRVISTGVNGWRHAARVFYIGAKNLTIKNSFLTGAQTTGSDYQTFSSINGSGPYYVYNNYIGDATENFMAGGGSQTIDKPLTDSIFEYNYFPHVPERTWKLRWDLFTGTGKGKNGLAYPGRIIMASSGTSTYIAMTGGYANGCSAAGCVGSVEPDFAGCVSGYVCTVDDGQITWRRTVNNDDWTIKNNFEIKNAVNTLIRRNVFEYMWPKDQETALNIKAETQQKFPSPSSQNNCIPTYEGLVDVAADGVTVTQVSTIAGLFPYNAAPSSTHGEIATQIVIDGVAYTISTYDTASQLTLVAPGTGGLLNDKLGEYGEPPESPCYAEWNYDTQVIENWIRNTSRPIKTTTGTNGRKDMSANLLIKGNLITDTDSAVWTDYQGGFSPMTSEARTHMNIGLLTNTRIESNTAIGGVIFSGVYVENPTRGDGRTFVLNNVFQGGSTYSYRGTSATPTEVNTIISGEGVAPVPAARYNRNIWTGSNLSTFSILGTHANICPGTSCLGTEPWDDLFTDHANAKYSIWAGSGTRAASTYKQWGVDGKDPGADLHKIPSINGLTVTAGDTEVLFRYSVSPVISDIPCVIEVHTSPDFELENFNEEVTGWAGEMTDMLTYYQQDSDQHDKWPGNATSRMLVVGHSVPLESSRIHFYRLQCGGDTREGTFTTTAAVAGTTTFRASSSSASSMTYGYAYSRAADEITGAVTGSCAGNVCTATVNKGVVYSRFGTGPVRATMIQ
jgi:hypothetical protein